MVCVDEIYLLSLIIQIGNSSFVHFWVSMSSFVTFLHVIMHWLDNMASVRMELYSLQRKWDLLQIIGDLEVQVGGIYYDPCGKIEQEGVADWPYQLGMLKIMHDLNQIGTIK